MCPSSEGNSQLLKLNYKQNSPQAVSVILFRENSSIKSVWHWTSNTVLRLIVSFGKYIYIISILWSQLKWMCNLAKLAGAASISCFAGDRKNQDQVSVTEEMVWVLKNTIIGVKFI